MEQEEPPGRTCKSCNTFFSTKRCNICARESRKKWVEKNPGKQAACEKAWREANKDKITRRRKDTRKNRKRTDRDIEKSRVRSLASYERNRQSIKLRLAEKYAENPNKYLAATNEWKKNNKDKRAIHNQNRRSRIRKAGGSLSNELIRTLLSKQSFKCACCGKSLEDGFHIDHILPLALGGKNEDTNIQLLTPKCNLQKNAKHPIDFMQERGFLL